MGRAQDIKKPEKSQGRWSERSVPSSAPSRAIIVAAQLGATSSDPAWLPLVGGHGSKVERWAGQVDFLRGWARPMFLVASGVAWISLAWVALDRL